MKRVSFSALALVGLVGSAVAEPYQTSSKREPASQSRFDVGGSAKFRGYSANNRDFYKSRRDKNDWIYNRFRLDLGYEPADTTRGFLQLQYGRVFGNDGQSGGTNYQMDTITAHQAYIHWSPAQFDVMVGRQKLHYGNGFVLSGWDDENGVSFDALRASYNSSYIFFDQVDVFGALMAARNQAAQDINSQPYISGRTNSEERPAYLVGTYFQKKDMIFDNLDLYALYYNEGFSNSTTGADGTLFPKGEKGTTNLKHTQLVDSFTTVGSRLAGKFLNGMWDVSAEGGYQFGKVRTLNYDVNPGRRPPWSREGELRAHAFSVESGLTFGDLRLAALYAYASGDEAKTQDKQEGWQSLYGTGSYLLNSWGMLSFSNVTDYGLRAQYQLTEKLKLDGGMHRLMLNDLSAGPVSASGASVRAPHNSNPFPTCTVGEDVDGCQLIRYNRGVIAETFDLWVKYQATNKWDFAAAVLAVDPGPRYVGKDWATMGFLEANYRF